MSLTNEHRVSHAPPASRPWLIDQFRQRCGYRFPRLGATGFAAIIKSLPAIIETQLFPGLWATIDLRDETQRTTYWFGTRFEEPTPQVLSEWAEGATHFFDIGSNYGFYSFFLRSLSADLSIYPFEPGAIPFQHLMEICEVNHTSRIHPQPYGLSDHAARLQFLQLSGNTGHSSFATVHACAQSQPGDSLIECEVITFDQATAYLGLAYPAKPSWIAKIDVEGFEMKVLLGMAEALRRHAFKGICIELVEVNLVLAGTSGEQVNALLQSHGYHQTDREGVSQRQGRNPNAYYTPTNNQS